MSKLIAVVALLGLGIMRVDAADMASPKEIALRFYQDVFNKHDIAAIDRYLAKDFIDHNPDPGQKPGSEGVKEFFQILFAAFPDVRVTTEQVLVDGNIVTVRSTMEGTQEKDFMGIPAARKTFRITLIDIIQFKDGLATQRWGLLDAPTMMAQLAPATE